jgi:phosphorylcholine metabolism protein LicD
MNYLNILLINKLKKLLPTKVKNFVKKYIYFYSNLKVILSLLFHSVMCKKNIIVTQKKHIHDVKIKNLKSKTIVLIKENNFNELDAKYLINQFSKYIFRKSKIYLYVLNERKYLIHKLKNIAHVKSIEIPKLIKTKVILEYKEIYFYSRFFDYPGNKININRSTNNILVFQKLLNNKIRYSIAYGSLLGLIRNKRLLPWDYDVDFVILHKDLKIFLNLLNLLDKNKFKVRRLNNSLVTFDRDNDQFDVYFLKEKKDKLIPDIDQPQLWWNFTDFFNQMDISIGKNNFKIPKNYIKLLDRWYGDWSKIIKR